MFKKDIHPARKVFRGFLLLCLGISCIFAITIVGMRIAYKGKSVPLEWTDSFFHADVFQHRVLAAVSNDEKDMEIAERLIQLSFFSPIYWDAGIVMLQDKSDKGYQPATIRLALLKNPPVQEE